MTIVAASIPISSPGDVDRGLDLALAASGAGAGLVEWRVDELASETEDDRSLERLIAESPVPVIITCRPKWEGGRCDCEESTRIAFLERAMSADIPPRYVDIELAAFDRDPWLADHLGAALSSETGLIVSSHDFDGRPADLMQRIEAMAAIRNCAVIKIAWHARSLRDNLEALELLSCRPKPMIALCMGRFGLPSRVLAAKAGGLVTFACFDDESTTAPGQVDVETMVSRYRVGQLDASTSVYGVIGWPVEHSRGPQLHNRAMAEANFNGVYLPLPVADDYLHFKATVGAFLDDANMNFRGASVTIPHKQNLMTFVEERGGTVDDLSRRIGAANTLLVGDDGSLSCTNTDAPAAVQILREAVGVSGLVNKQVAVLGAGGVARALVAGLVDAGANVSIFNRTADRARALAEEMHRDSPIGSVAAPELSVLTDQRFDLIINATSVGMEGGPAPEATPLGMLGADPVFDDDLIIFDTVYTPLDTPLLTYARLRGVRTISGMELFIRQADRQFRLWTGAGMAKDVLDQFSATARIG